RFYAYYVLEGGPNVLGYPISRPFELLGCGVQMFENRILVWVPGRGVAQLAFYGTELFPYDSVHSFTLPALDPDLLGSAPNRVDPSYILDAEAFAERNLVDEAFGMPVGFRHKYLNTPCATDGDAASLRSLLFWGVP